MIFKITPEEMSIKNGIIYAKGREWNVKNADGIYKSLMKDYAKVIIDFDNGDSIEILLDKGTSHERHLSCNAIINKLHGYA